MTINLIKIFKKCNRYVSSYLPEQITVSEVKEQHEINVNFYVKIKSSENKNFIYLDLSLLLMETRISTANNWNDFENIIPEFMTLAYIVPGSLIDIESPDRKQVWNISPLGMQELLVGYCDHRTPEDRNKFMLRWHMPDLVINKNIDYILKHKLYFPINLENCIVSCNGLITRPLMFNNELLILDGAKSFWSTKYSNLNMFMMDFTDLNGYEIIKFSECKYFNKNRNIGKISTSADVVVQFPDHVDLSTKTLMMVIGGRLYFPDEILFRNYKSIFLQPFKLNLPQALLMLNNAHNNYVRNTNIIITNETVDNFFDNLLKNDTSHSFFILINNPKVIIRRELLFPEFKYYTNNDYNKTDAIMINKNTGSIVDYTAMRYNNFTTHYSNITPSMYKIDDWNNNGKQLGCLATKCDHIKEYIPNYNEATYEFVYLTA